MDVASDDIDWSAIQLSRFEYHIIPFSTDLETLADIEIVQQLIDHDVLAFLNPEILIDSSIRAYERIYSIYSKACNIYANPFDVFFEDMIVVGWPEGVSYELDDWNGEDVRKITRALNANAIRMKPNERFQEEIDKANSTLKRKKVKVTKSFASFSPQSKADSIDEQEDGKMTGSVGSLGSSVDVVSCDNSNSPQFQRVGSVGIMSNMKQQASQLPGFDFSRTPGFDTYVGKSESVSLSCDKDEPNRGLKRSAGALYDDENTTKSMIASATGDLDDDEGKMVVNAPITDPSIVQVGECSGSTYYGLNYIIERTRATFFRFLEARSAYPIDSRHYRIHSLILDCFEIILGHMDTSLNGQIPPQISMDEASEYLKVFNGALASISTEGDMDPINFRNYVIAAVKFRALQAGRPVNIPKSGPRQRFVIVRLQNNTKTWRFEDVELLEFALFGDGTFFVHEE